MTESIDVPLTGAALVEALTRPGRAESMRDQVTLPGAGVIHIRALTRDEVIGVRKAVELDPAGIDGGRALGIERKMLALAMVNPVMTEDQIRSWQRSAPAGEIDLVTNAVQQLSGMHAGAAKEAFRPVRDPS